MRPAIDSMLKLQQYHALREARLSASAEKLAYSIAISREPHTLGTEVAHDLAHRLGWACYDHQIIDAVAKDMKVRTELVEGLDQKSRQWLEQILLSFSGEPDQSNFAIHLKKIIATLGREGHAVFLGRGAGHILPAESCLRVRIVGSMAVRLRRLMDAEKLSKDEGLRKLETLDRARNEFLRDFCRVDASDAHRYDVVLNTDHLSVRGCANAILAVAQDRFADFPPVA